MATALKLDEAADTPPIEDIRETLLERARAMIPVLRARAPEAEKLRRLPDATVRDIIDAGLMRVSVAKPFGGYPGAEFDCVLEIAMELARGCPSTAWCYTIWSSHNLSMSRFQEEIRDEYYAPGPDVISSTARMTIAERMEIVEGGLRLTGHYNFSSGCDHASWFIIMGKNMVGMLLKREEVELVDNWHSMGLRATGSNGVLVKDVFVPAQRIWGLFDDDTMIPPVFVRNERFSDAVAGPMLAYTALSIVVGAAQGAVDAFTETYRGKATPPMADSGAGDSVPIQARLAEASAEVDAARLMMMSDCRWLLDTARAGGQITLADRFRVRRNMALISRLSSDAANRLFQPTGGRAIANGNVIQRFFLDTLAAAHHATLPGDRLFENYGKLALGFPPHPDYVGGLFHPSLVRDMVPA